MRTLHCALLLAVLAQPATAQQSHSTKHRATAAAPSAGCSRFARDYEQASKTMAENYAQGIFDNSAVRETMRESANNRALSEARMTLDLMRSNHCKVPNYTPNYKRYMIPAINCEGARGKDDELDKCDQDKWAPVG